MKKEENKNYVLLYGSLRKGEFNYDRFMNYYPNGINYQETITIKGFDLYSLGSYPGIKQSEDKDKPLVVDSMIMSDEAFNSVDAMERGAGYTRLTVNVNNIPHTIYLYEGRVSQERLVESGDWSLFLNPKKVAEAAV